MLPEVGLITLIFAFLLSIFVCSVPILQRIEGQIEGQEELRILPATVYLLFAMLAASFIVLWLAFITDDFSVQYVASHSNLSLPYSYKMVAIWGGHEGSLLLWWLVLVSWMALVTFFRQQINLVSLSYIMQPLALVGIALGIILLFFSNPFVRLSPSPLDGLDLNPLLQDTAMLIHPPMLYIGYVGLYIPLAFLTASIRGEQRELLVFIVRKWTLLAWAILGIGIVLGSWWAYYELGWGGWWFWDPVENASFMPWFASIGLIHSLIATDNRKKLQTWTYMLAVLVFSLSIIGTFLVRSGILNSVHAFASNPDVGIVFLLVLLIVVGTSLILFYQAEDRKTQEQIAIDKANDSVVGLFSKEFYFLAQNILFATAALSILLGTIYPLLLLAFTGKEISVGAPYFNTIFSPIVLALAILAAGSLYVRWGKSSAGDFLNKNKTVFSIVIFAILIVLASTFNKLSFKFAAAIAIAIYLIGATSVSFYNKWKKQKKFQNIPLSSYAMTLAHLGLGISILGVSLLKAYEIEEELLISENEVVVVGDLKFRLTALNEYSKDNYKALRATVEVSQGSKHVTTMYPEKRFFIASKQIMTETAISPGFLYDIYLSLGDKVQHGWTCRIYIKPYLRWIWLGVFLMSIGGFLAFFKKRKNDVQFSKQVTK